MTLPGICNLLKILVLLSLSIALAYADRGGGASSWGQALSGADTGLVADYPVAFQQPVEAERFPQPQNSANIGATAPITPTTRIDFAPLRQGISYGDYATVTLEISNADRLYAVIVQASFDPTVLQVVDANLAQPGVQIAPGNFLTPTQSIVVYNNADNDKGDIAYAVAVNQGPPVSGNGILASILFQGSGVGTGKIAFKSVLMFYPGAIPIDPIIIGNDAEIQVSPPPNRAYLPLTLRNFVP